MSDQSREQFEIEWEKVHGQRPTRSTALGGENSYEGRADVAWWAWQASREAVVVELPETHKPAPEDDERWHNMRNSTIGACRRAIEAAGLKVAP